MRNFLKLVKWSVYIYFYRFYYCFWKLKLLLLIEKFKFTFDKIWINFKDAQPKIFSLLTDLIYIGTKKTLFECFFTHYLIAVFIEAYQLLKCSIWIYEWNNHAYYLNYITLSKFFHSIVSLPQGILCHFPFTEHTSCVLLIRL